MAILTQPSGLAHDPLRFVAIGVGEEFGDESSVGILGEEFFRDTSGVVLDDGVGGVEDGRGGAVVLLKLDQLCVGEVLGEGHDVVIVGTSPGVDALVGVAGDVDVLLLVGQPHDQLVLKVVGVLVLIDQQISEAIVVDVRHAGDFLEEPDGEEQKVVEVHGVAFLEAFFVVFGDFLDDGQEIQIFVVLKCRREGFSAIFAV